MRSTQPTVLLVWDFGSEATQPQYPTLRAVDLDYELAKQHREYLQQKGIKVMIESCSANHLFGELGNTERIEKRRPL
jgi:hypothetical protein